MSRKAHRVPVTLDPKDVAQLPPGDLTAILRAADPLIASGGRTLLSHVLKGSRQKKILELGLQHCPAFGHFRHLSLGQIMARIDRAILDGYLATEYSGRLPLIVFTAAGWEIERDTYSTELLERLRQVAVSPDAQPDVSFLKDRNRGMILLLLDKIEATRNPAFIPVLEQWELIDYRKVRERIRRVIEAIRQPGGR